jgi:hypothetical protein
LTKITNWPVYRKDENKDGYAKYTGTYDNSFNISGSKPFRRNRTNFIVMWLCYCFPYARDGTHSATLLGLFLSGLVLGTCVSVNVGTDPSANASATRSTGE